MFVIIILLRKVIIINGVKLRYFSVKDFKERRLLVLLLCRLMLKEGKSGAQARWLSLISI